MVMRSRPPLVENRLIRSVLMPAGLKCDQVDGFVRGYRLIGHRLGRRNVQPHGRFDRRRPEGQDEEGEQLEGHVEHRRHVQFHALR